MAPLTGRTRWRSERGVELIEMALTLPLLMLVVLGILEFGFIFQEFEVVTNAAREGARIAVLPEYTSADAVARVNQYLTVAGLDLARATVPNPVADTTALGATCISTVLVDVTYQHPIAFLNPFMTYFGASSLATLDLKGHAQMRSETAAACP